MATPDEVAELSQIIEKFRSRMNGLSAPERQAEALVEIAIELKWLRHYVGNCDDYLNEIANKLS
jgi:hypothetical protein